MLGVISAQSIDVPDGYPPVTISKIELPAGAEKNDFFTLNEDKQLYINTSRTRPTISDATKIDANGDGVFTLKLKVTTSDGKVHEKTLDITLKRRAITLQINNMEIVNDKFLPSVIDTAKKNISLKTGTIASDESISSLGTPNLVVKKQDGTNVVLDANTPKNYGPGVYKIVFVDGSEFNPTGSVYENYNISYDDSGTTGKLTVTAEAITSGDLTFNIKNGDVITDLTKFYNTAVQLKPSAEANAKGFTHITD